MFCYACRWRLPGMSSLLSMDLHHHRRQGHTAVQHQHQQQQHHHQEQQQQQQQDQEDLIHYRRLLRQGHEGAGVLPLPPLLTCLQV